jgi:Peptidase family M1 domain
MFKSSVALVILAAPLAAPLAAQAAQRPPFQPTTDTSVFAPLTVLPSPNAYREGSGMPGPEYWQNSASYDLQATLDTAAKMVHGHLVMRYTNHSPDTLRFIWIQTEQNAFKEGSLNSFIYPAGSRFGAQNFQGGDVIESYDQVLPAVGKQPAKHVALHLIDNGTVTEVELARPLAPGATGTFESTWHFLVPPHGADRMGRDGSLYEIAQWYPRVCVYDDIRGWNTDPYLGQGEFYEDYGDYTVAVTVPAGYIVAGTGTLQNPTQVLTATEMHRLASAAKSDTTIGIATQAELVNGTARPRSTGTMTWKFAAHNVRDAVWAGSPDYIWDASSYKGVIANAYYRPSAAAVWNDGADQARMSIEEYSERWFPYPYPQISVVEGPISGMEYPMLAMEARSNNKFGLYNVITHEIGHNWFPMIVGSNEREYMWQDEGFNTFINMFSEARRYPQNGTEMQRALQDRTGIERVMAAGVDQPMMINPDRVNPFLLGVEEYTKPSVGLQLLRQEILGPELFDEAFRTYIRRWAYKHPAPADFFRTMEDVSGRRLDWFWREWWFENDHFDQDIDSVKTAATGDTLHVAVWYGNRDRGVMPIRARLTFADSTVVNYDYPAEVWSTNTAQYLRQYTFVGKGALTKVELDPDHLVVDINRSNNTWTAQ